jgi:hypothetical protein
MFETAVGLSHYPQTGEQYPIAAVTGVVSFQMTVSVLFVQNFWKDIYFFLNS